MRGGQTLVGHCYEEGSLSLPYLPFVEAMRSYVVDAGPRRAHEAPRHRRRRRGAHRLGGARPRAASSRRAAGDPEDDRWRLLQAVDGLPAQRLRRAAAAASCSRTCTGPTAARSTCCCTSRATWPGARLLIVGTYRDVEVDRTHPLSAALAELRRVGSFQRIPLRGLTPDEVQRMLSNIAGQEVPFALAEAVHRQTEGNPLFVQEVLRYPAERGLIVREGGAVGRRRRTESLISRIPEGLRDVIGKRLSRLSAECNHVLSVAAVIGRDFALDVLQRVAGVTEDELLTALEEAVQRLAARGAAAAGRALRYRFTHAFFRQTLYEEMIAPRRLRLHQEVARALEAHYARRVEEHAAELAEHFSHSSTEADLRKAVEYGELAAARAASVFAYGEAARLPGAGARGPGGARPERRRSAYSSCLMELTTALLSAGEPERVLEDVGPRAFELAESLGQRTRSRPHRRDGRLCADLPARQHLVHHAGLSRVVRAHRTGMQSRTPASA